MVRGDRKGGARGTSASFTLILALVAMPALAMAGTGGEGSGGTTTDGGGIDAGGQAAGREGTRSDGVSGGEGGVLHLENPQVSDSKVKEKEKLRFSVYYRHEGGVEPDYVALNVDGDTYWLEMERNQTVKIGRPYVSDSITFGRGEHLFFFFCRDLEGNKVNTSSLNMTFRVEKDESPGSLFGDDQDMCYLYLAFFMVFSITMLLMMSMLGRVHRERLEPLAREAVGNCPSCGEPKEEADATFCTRCGARFEGKKEPCGYCGELRDVNARRCPHCNKKPEETGDDSGPAGTGTGPAGARNVKKGTRPARGARGSGVGHTTAGGKDGKGKAGRRGAAPEKGSRPGKAAGRPSGSGGEDGHFDEIITCTTCGAVVSDSMSECPGCGEPFEDDEAGGTAGRSSTGSEGDGGAGKLSKAEVRGRRKGRVPGWKGGDEKARAGTGVDFLCSVCGCGVREDAAECPKCGNRFL